MNLPHKSLTSCLTNADPEPAQDRVKGITFMTDPSRHKSPWKLTLYHDGGDTKTFHATKEDAVKAKGKAERLKAKEGSKALGYDRAAQVEYEAIKKMAGPNVPLVPLLKDLVQKRALKNERKTVEAAVAHLLVAKEQKGLAHNSQKDMRLRLGHFAAQFQGRSMETLTRNELLDWLNGLGYAPRTTLNWYRLVTNLMNYAERRDWIDVNPMRKIDPKTDLPKIRKVAVPILDVAQGAGVMRYLEQHEPRLIPWACLQYFCGLRDATTERVRGEWIHPDKKRIILPGNILEEGREKGEETQITKRGDDWIMDDLPEAFWAWVARYPEGFAKESLHFPSNRAWSILRDGMIAEGIFEQWPFNGFRHSFATYHLSAYRNQTKTSLILHHEDARQLWASYFAKLVPQSVGMAYLSLSPLPR